MNELKIRQSNHFEKVYKKLDNSTKSKAKKIIAKIIENPSIGKPMRNVRKGTRELYLKPFRLSYAYDTGENILTLLDIYHKKKQ